MAEGRILSKRVTKSDKIAALGSDTSRMFYSWIIPYLDVEGRMEANTRLMKGEIAPLLDHITPEKIQEILDELNRAELIVLYEINKKQYLQLMKFDENQPNLRKDREKKSVIPKPPEIKKQVQAQLRQAAGVTPAELRPDSRGIPSAIREASAEAQAVLRPGAADAPAAIRQNAGTAPAALPQKINIKEGNIREAKTEEAAFPAVDNSASVPQTVPVENAFFKELNKEFSGIMEKIRLRYDYKQQQHIENWIKSNYRGKHPQAMIHTLNALTKTPDTVRDIEKYLDKIIAVENQNYNYNDFQKKADELKKPGMFSIGDIFAGIKLYARGMTSP